MKIKLLISSKLKELCFTDGDYSFSELVITSASGTFADDELVVWIRDYKIPIEIDPRYGDTRAYTPPEEEYDGPNRTPPPLKKFRNWKEIENLSDEERGELLVELNKLNYDSMYKRLKS